MRYEEVPSGEYLVSPVRSSGSTFPGQRWIEIEFTTPTTVSHLSFLNHYTSRVCILAMGKGSSPSLPPSATPLADIALMESCHSAWDAENPHILCPTDLGTLVSTPVDKLCLVLVQPSPLWRPEEVALTHIRIFRACPIVHSAYGPPPRLVLAPPRALPPPTPVGVTIPTSTKGVSSKSVSSAVTRAVSSSAGAAYVFAPPPPDKENLSIPRPNIMTPPDLEPCTTASRYIQGILTEAGRLGVSVRRAMQAVPGGVSVSAYDNASPVMDLRDGRLMGE
ncbi:hypothetical protein KIPB_011383 [Kipferlia bialata]|uniref:Uncharacterized protein n=1 Tax=Kipferlia bialata TaxID=797122 RepID=A0A9K3GNQ7_9EUKA|nr:hypothetical protein KIPB_011383 [Kipferlia bialata]|eukprot:g11383.t1